MQRTTNEEGQGYLINELPDFASAFQVYSRRFVTGIGGNGLSLPAYEIYAGRIGSLEISSCLCI